MSIMNLARASTAALALAAGVPATVAGAAPIAAYLAAPEPSTDDGTAAEAPESQRGPPAGTHGAFVQSQLDAGLRGRDLAAAIHAEKGERNPGRGHAEHPDHGRGH